MRLAPFLLLVRSSWKGTCRHVTLLHQSGGGQAESSRSQSLDALNTSGGEELHPRAGR
jgi:hypothetical protein